MEMHLEQTAKRHTAKAAFLGALVLSALPASPLAAQSRTSAEEAVEITRDLYGPPPPVQSCSTSGQEEGSDNEITVCAERMQDDSEFRVKSTSDLDRESREALDNGVPAAPDVAGDGIFKGKASVGGLCLLGGCPPEEAYMIDFELLPDTPEGSDADKIAKKGNQ